GKRPWQQIDQPFIEYQFLPHGKYIFQVATKYKAGTWSDVSTHTLIVHPFWWQTWYFVFGLVVMIASVFALSIKLVAKRLERKYQKEKLINKRMSELELKALQAQLNPHFIFNAMNSIQLILWNENRKLADEYLSKFGRLMRLYLEASRNEFHSLEEEIELITLYVKLESLRFKSDLQVTMDVDDALDLQSEFPTMILQPFVENAINHGLSHKTDDRQLNIRFSQTETTMTCTIEDNGIGRAATADFQNKYGKDHISRASQIVAEKIEVIEKIDHLAIQIDFVDKYDKNESATGTIVKITIPYSVD
ncbi:MAG: histidine kinase, partial [Bacteroidota bacterium]